MERSDREWKNAAIDPCEQMIDVSQLITKDAWNRIGVKHHHGINLPLSALRSKNDCGIGEFLDLLPLIDWCKKLGLDVIQLLPLNDSGNDPSPYNALSSRALHPLYLSLYALPYLEENSPLRKRLSEFENLNKAPRIAYQEVISYKLAWLRDYFSKYGKKVQEEPGYSQFIKENSWVEPYALFKVIKEKLANTHSQTWPKEYLALSREDYQKKKEDFKDEISFFITLQYLCFSQMMRIKQHAAESGVFIKGDIPILISSDSADVWNTPQFFDISFAAGSPPDVYNKEGQYWGFPLFNWEKLKQDQFNWWKSRLGFASNFYSIYRIDHVIGFFRIWGIPLSKLPHEGGFIPKDEKEWGPLGKELLAMMISSSPMLPIAEDLGIVPPVVPQCMQELGICGTKVIRWERLWKKKDKPFIPYQEYLPISMTTVSTHDSGNLQLWWKQYPEEAKDFAAFKKWTYAPEITRAQLQEILQDSHRTSSLFHINLLNEYLALFPELVSPNLEDERINIPGKILPTNWTYRFRPYIEDLIAHQDLENTLRAILK